MNTFKLLMFTCLLVTFNTHAYVVFSTYGSCKTWNKYVQNEIRDKDNPYLSDSWTSSLVSWLAGFTSAINMSTGEENFPDTDLETIKEYVINYCEKNPTGTAYDAVVEIITKLMK